MLACLDVHYQPGAAGAAAVVFSGWQADSPGGEYTARIPVSAAYRPGQFYRRELAPLLAVISQIRETVEVFIIDAYCDLSTRGTPGLGRYLFRALAGESAVVGVAKSRYRQTDHAAVVFRGGSRRPLYVTAIGLAQDEAAAMIAGMAGNHRIPELLKAADRLAHAAVSNP